MLKGQYEAFLKKAREFLKAERFEVFYIDRQEECFQRDGKPELTVYIELWKKFGASELVSALVLLARVDVF